MEIKASNVLQSQDLTAFFSAYTSASTGRTSKRDLFNGLSAFSGEFPAFSTDPERPIVQELNESALSAFFSIVSSPLEAEKEGGGLVNLWTITGLKRNEVRTAGALAGLWRYSFGGRVSLTFLAHYLQKAIPELNASQHMNWQRELQQGYGVFAEVNPLGDTSDRVDLMIETAYHLVGIEVKIGAVFELTQLERYKKSLESRAQHIQKSWHLILLDSRKPPVQDPPFHFTSWKDVAAAARSTGGGRLEQPTLIHHLIGHFGQYVFSL